MSKPIYFDNAATTPVDPRVLEVMLKYLSKESNFGNPASRSHEYGWIAEQAVDTAREQVARLIGADSKDIIWTSGATESDNLAIKGIAEFYQKKGKHIITSTIEHKAVLDTCRHLETKGFTVSYLKPNNRGLISPKQVKQALQQDTILVSIMHVNNEIGTIQDIKAIGKVVKEHGAFFHVDAAQSAGKTEINVEDMKIDLLSCCAHKIYGPKGIGALYVRRKPRVRLVAQIHGGGHERGMRSGTLATHQIAGMGEAFRLAKLEMKEEHDRLLKLRQRFLQKIQSMEEVYINGDLDSRIPGNINVSFNYVEGESLMMALRGLAISSGSACTSANLEPSYVLRAIGRSDALAHSSIRFSFGRFTTKQEIDQAVDLIKINVDKLRQLSPLWEMYKDGIDIDSIEWAAH